ncbi:MAG: transposase [Mariprofundus sp.]|nr:transposase [Mariprofundus sp.]
MVRPLRIEYEGALYHVTSRGNHKSDIFADDEDRHIFLRILSNTIIDKGWICYGYCLMSNHYHLIIETPHANLSKGMRQLNGIYTQTSNRRHDRIGHLFQGRYKAILVDADAYLLELSRYVALNPVRAGMVSEASQWLWSSYRAMAGLDQTPSLLTSEPVLSYFSEQNTTPQQQYAKFVAEGESKKSVWSELRQQIFLGREAFVLDAHHKTSGSSYDSNIPKIQQLPPAKSLSEIAELHEERDDAIVAAYQTGAYSYSQIGRYFNIHFTTVGRIVRKQRVNSPRKTHQ